MAEQLGRNKDAIGMLSGNPLSLLRPIKSMVSWLLNTGKEMWEAGAQRQAEIEKQRATREAKKAAIHGKEWWRIITFKKK